MGLSINPSANRAGTEEELERSASMAWKIGLVAAAVAMAYFLVLYVVTH